MNPVYRELNQGQQLRRLQQLETKHVRDYNRTASELSLTLATHMREQIIAITEGVKWEVRQCN